MEKFNFKIVILFIVVYAFQSVYTQSEDVNLESLQLVQVIFRHGERVPEYPYPTDPYNSENFWKEGWGQLTEKGKEQEYQLGQYLRGRYKTFISSNYVANELFVLSSDLDRTIMSAQLVLAGLFPTPNGTTWGQDIKWQPIPVHTIETKNDNILRCKRNCPKFDEELEHLLYDSPEMQKINADNAQMFEYLSNHTGLNITNIEDIDSFYATMMVEEMLGLAIPSWAVPVIHTENFQNLYNKSFGVKSSTPQLKRFRAGPLLDKLELNFHEKITNSSMKTKFFMFSAHDTTLINLLNTLDIWDNLISPYSAMVIMELHKNPETSNYFVNFLFRNETDKEPYRLKLPNCQFDCQHDEFVKIIEPFIPENWDSECLLELPSSQSSRIMLYILIAAAALVLLALAYCIISKLLCKKSRRNENYERM